MLMAEMMHPRSDRQARAGAAVVEAACSQFQVQDLPLVVAVVAARSYMIPLSVY